MPSAFTHHQPSLHQLLRLCLATIFIGATLSTSQGEPTAEAPPVAQNPAPNNIEAVQNDEPPRLPAPKNAKPMPAPHRVWVDAKQRQVIVDGYVSLDEGLLEMFACPAGTKEHESIVAVHSAAQIVHAALLAVGAKPGTPVRWEPKFAPPTGTQIDIEVRWLDPTDPTQKKWLSCPAQQWINDLNTNKPMAHHWVFAGSGFWKDEQSGQEYYLAESGDFICVSNFSTATLDIPAPIGQNNANLYFEANKEKVPPIGTPVRLVLKPKLEKQQPSPQSPSTNETKLRNSASDR